MTAEDEKEEFARIFVERRWGGSQSVSGSGSDLGNTVKLRRELPDILRRLGVRSLVDASCGDMNWMRLLDYQFDSFIGIDIVPELVRKLLDQNWPDRFHFQVGNIVTDILPTADAVFCRDCLVHLPFRKIEQAERLFQRAGSRYVIATTFPTQKANNDCRVGDWRPLNMSIEPFCWGEPLLVLPERNPGDGFDYPDKSVGAWALDTIVPRT